MGMAKAAELNGYPGPLHVLRLVVKLALTEIQRRDVQAIFDRMNAAAKPLGGELIAQEQALDQLFAKGEITQDRLAAATAAIAELQGRLRAVHLSAHLETRALLNGIRSPVISSSGVTAIRQLRCGCGGRLPTGGNAGLVCCRYGYRRDAAGDEKIFGG
jgi:hypothetical protein